MEITNVLIIVLTCFAISALIVPVVKKIAVHVGALDKPEKRKIHKNPMPRLGGLGIFIAFIFGYILFSDQSTEMLSILMGSFFIIIIGIIDDIKPLPATIKLGGQLIATCIVVFYGGILLNRIVAFGFNIEFGILAYPITIFFILGAINAINFIDGLDGLAGGVSSIYFLTIGIIIFLLNQQGSLAFILTFIMLGSILGFLVHNFHPAKIFMGDSGSMFLGFIIAIVALLNFKTATFTTLIIPMLLLAIPIFDTSCAILRRKLKGRPISKPDKEHLHHQFLGMNLSHRKTVLLIYGINILFAFASIVHILNYNQLGMIIYILILAVLLWIITKTNIISDKKK